MQCEQCKFYALGNCRRYPKAKPVKPDYWCGEYKPRPKAKQVQMFEDVPLTLPKWVPVAEWDAYIDMRKKIKKPATEKAIPILINKLLTLKEAGSDPKEVLQQSIMRNYQGLFPIKKEPEQGMDKSVYFALIKRKKDGDYLMPKEREYIDKFEKTSTTK